MQSLLSLISRSISWWRNRPRFFKRPRAEYIEGVGWPIINDLNDALTAAGHQPVCCEDLDWVLHCYHWHRGNDMQFIEDMLKKPLLTKRA